MKMHFAARCEMSLLAHRCTSRWFATVMAQMTQSVDSSCEMSHCESSFALGGRADKSRRAKRCVVASVH